MAYFNYKYESLSNEAYMFTDKYRSLVEFIVEIKGTPNFDIERIIPSCGPEILINLNNSIIGKFHNFEAEINRGDFVVTGNRIDYFDSVIPDNSHYLVIKLTNIGYNRLIKLPIRNISNSYIKNLHENNLRTLTCKLTESLKFMERVYVLKRWIDNDYDNSHNYSVGEYLEKAIKCKPNSSSSALEKLTGYSSKYLNEIFKSYSGYTISNFKRLCRFHRALEIIKKEKTDVWTDLLYQCNYYDQSHFIKELKSFTGLTPSKLKENLKQENNHNLIF